MDTEHLRDNIRFDSFPRRIVEILDLDGEIRQETMNATMRDSECLDHLNIIDEFIELLKIFGIDKRFNETDEIALKELSFRIYNSASAAFSLLMGGLQQVSLMPQRDILECSLLFRLITLDKASMHQWKRGKEFKPKEVRKSLEKIDKDILEGFDSLLGVIYRDLTKRGIHPNFFGIATMLTKEGHPETIYPGPFFDLNKLRDSLWVFASILEIAVQQVIQAHKTVEDSLTERFGKYVDVTSIWIKKYDPTTP